MNKTYFEIPAEGGNIPALLWGEPSSKVLIAVHGNFSHKEDEIIAVAAEEAAGKGYTALSFDLPAPHPARAVAALSAVHRHAQTLAPETALFACSLGAYFSLLSYGETPIEKALFLSPVVSMLALIRGMMKAHGIGESRLEEEKIIPLPDGQVLDWGYFSYVQSHPITRWEAPTSILCGGKDALCPAAEAFCRNFGTALHLELEAGHFFHTPSEIAAARRWMRCEL